MTRILQFHAPADDACSSDSCDCPTCYDRRHDEDMAEWVAAGNYVQYVPGYGWMTFNDNDRKES